MATKKATTKNQPATKKAAGKKPAGDKPGKGELKRHPLSEKYGPKLVDDELQGLAADIKANGQHEPIILYEGMVLAGWNRYKACLVAKREPLTREMDKGSNPVAVAFGTNFMRRKLSSIQKAFFGAQYCLEANLKQSDVAKNLACNLNRLNQCCQLLKLDNDESRKVVEQLRDNPEMGSAQFDEYMLELGIAREPRAAPPRPARASAGGPLDGDDDDPLGGDLDGDDLTGGAIDDILGNDDDLGDESSPDPAKRKAKGEVGDDAPLPSVGGKRTKLTNPHETPVSKVAKAFKVLNAEEQRKFVRFAWAKLRGALDEAFSHGDVEYTMPAIKVDPSVIARNKPADKLDDGHQPKGKKGTKAKPTPAKKSTPATPATRSGSAKAPAKAAKPPAKSTPATRSGSAKGKANGKHAEAHDEDI